MRDGIIPTLQKGKRIKANLFVLLLEITTMNRALCIQGGTLWKRVKTVAAIREGVIAAAALLFSQAGIDRVSGNAHLSIGN